MKTAIIINNLLLESPKNTFQGKYHGLLKTAQTANLFQQFVYTNQKYNLFNVSILVVRNNTIVNSKLFIQNHLSIRVLRIFVIDCTLLSLILNSLGVGIDLSRASYVLLLDTYIKINNLKTLDTFNTKNVIFQKLGQRNLSRTQLA